MNKFITFAAGLICIHSGLANVVDNADFSRGDKTLSGWKVMGRSKLPAGGGKVKARNAYASWIDIEGNKCLLLESSGDNAHVLVSSKRVPLVGGYKYSVSVKYKSEGLMQESGDRKKYAAAIMDMSFINDRRQFGGSRIITHVDSRGWGTLSRTNRWKKYIIPKKDCVCEVRLALVNKYPGNNVKIWWDEVNITPLDAPLRNAGFEDGKNTLSGWSPVGGAKSKWVSSPVKSGKKAVAVSDAPEGRFSGWMAEYPVRPDRKYVFGGYVKGGDLNPNGFIGGGALQLQFVDSSGNVLGKPVTSKAVGTKTDWTKVETTPVQPPANAVIARLVAGMNYCNGTAWFDDLYILAQPAAMKDEVLLQRKNLVPCAGVKYAENLLNNGDMEQGAKGKPAHWTYHGKSAKDWTPAEIKRFHDKGRPDYSIGRGRGVWSDTIKYAGRYSLCNVSIDPPLSPRNQWYGRNPVDGYWISDPMPCKPGQAYIAGGWIKPGAIIESAWYGPLLIEFYDKRGNKLQHQSGLRSSMNNLPQGIWSWWATQPQVAPAKAASMRLMFAQEIRANQGGWGMTYADNLAVWKVPQGAPVKDIPGLDNRAYREWFIKAHRFIKPPYMASPESVPAYASTWGSVKNLQIGNLFSDPDVPALMRFSVFNLLGERRTVKLKILRTDWLGNSIKPLETPAVELDGFSEGVIEYELPETGSYGAFYLDVTTREGKAVVGEFSGRYAVMPELKRPKTSENIWAVTPLYKLKVDGSPFEKEYGKVMQIAGFGNAWIRIFFNCSPYDKERVDEVINKVKKEVCWYRDLGIKPILQINPPRLPRTYPRKVDKKLYFKVGEIIGKEFRGLVRAIGNWGIEQANSKSPYRGGGKLRITDYEYDTMLGCMYDGIKSVAPEMPVMIGNIATDFNADTIRRLYKAPANGRFQGAFFNAYSAQIMVGQNMIKEFDRHGNKDYTIWNEEQANQRSPHSGDARRYGEADGPKNMVRTWLSMATKLHPRIKTITMWGFAPTSAQDIMMMTPDLQPRPQYVAHAVMANALADAKYLGDRSTGDMTILEWQRGDGHFFAVWANSGKRSLTLDVSSSALTVMDLMGNCKQVKAENGLVSLGLTSMPFYLFGGGKISVSERVLIKVSNGTVKAGSPMVSVNVVNNGKDAIAGKMIIAGPGLSATEKIALKGGSSKTYKLPVSGKLPDDKRSSFRAEVKLDNGAVFASIGEFDFACAVKADTPPAIDGTWKGWGKAETIEFGKPGQIEPQGDVGEKYTGKRDIYGKLKMLWDDNFLYLGVEALDDVFLPNPERGTNGFMGDSLEFGVQPDNIIRINAPKYEFELYSPDGKYVASRRFPLPGGFVSHWKACVKKTGTRGNVVYQVAIPWQDIGVSKVYPGSKFSLSVVLNDKDNPEGKFSGRRTLIHWFEGVNSAKNPEKYGDVVLVKN